MSETRTPPSPLLGRGGWHQSSVWFLQAAVFLLPWQTRWIFASPVLNGGVWEYGIGSVYAVEGLLLAAAVFGDRKKQGAALKRLGWPGAVFAGCLIVSAVIGVAPSVSFGALIHFAFASLFALVLATTDVSRVHLASAFVGGLVPAAILGWFQTFSGANPASSWLGLAERFAATSGAAVVETASVRLLRAYGPFPHPNIFGGVLVAGIVASLWLDTKTFRVPIRVGNAIAAVLLAATLVITFSRSALLSLFLVLVILGFFAWKRQWNFKNWAFIGMAVGLVAAALWFRAPLLSRTDEMNRLEQRSVSERVGQYREWVGVFHSSPWFGTGTSGYTARLASLFPERASFDLQPIHNAPLLFLAEQGILGVLAFAWLLVVGGRRLLDTRSRPLFLILLIPLLPLLFLDHYLWSSWAGLTLFTLDFSAILCYSRKS